MSKDIAGYILDDDDGELEVSENVVKSILDDTNVDKDDIVDILKTIEYKRVSYGFGYGGYEEEKELELPGRPYDKIEEYELSRGLKLLLDFCLPANLLSTFEELKYYQIQTVIEAANPYEVLINL